jgi:hypothetical protein
MATLFVTFHGGSGPSSINQLIAFPEGGGESYSALGGGPPKLDELRAFLPSQDGGQLYVANGSKTRDQVLLFSSPGAPGQPWQFADIYATAGISHRSTSSSGSAAPSSSRIRTRARSRATPPRPPNRRPSSRG